MVTLISFDNLQSIVQSTNEWVIPIDCEDIQFLKTSKNPQSIYIASNKDNSGKTLRELIGEILSEFKPSAHEYVAEMGFVLVFHIPESYLLSVQELEYIYKVVDFSSSRNSESQIKFGVATSRTNEIAIEIAIKEISFEVGDLIYAKRGSLEGVTGKIIKFIDNESVSVYIGVADSKSYGMSVTMNLSDIRLA